MEEINYSIEEALQLLEKHLNVLEGADAGLAEAFNTYNEGMKLIDYCNKKLDAMQADIELIKNSKKEVD